MVDDVGGGRDDRTVAAVAILPTAPGTVGVVAQMAAFHPSGAATAPKTGTLEQLLQRLGGARTLQPASSVKTGITAMETLLDYGAVFLVRQNRPWGDPLSCAGCVEKVGSGYVVISPHVVTERRRAENGD